MDTLWIRNIHLNKFGNNSLVSRDEYSCGHHAASALTNSRHISVSWEINLERNVKYNELYYLPHNSPKKWSRFQPTTGTSLQQGSQYMCGGASQVTAAARRSVTARQDIGWCALYWWKTSLQHQGPKLTFLTGNNLEPIMKSRILSDR